VSSCTPVTSSPSSSAFGRVLVASFALLASGLLATPLSAQVLYGSIVGVVKDAQGAAVPAATITVVNKETNFTREGLSNQDGEFTLANVLPGRYDVKVSLQGFREFVRTDVPITPGQISRVDAKLDIGALAETVTVESSAQLLQTDKTDVHTS
jgi:hypothetical protein